MNFLRKIVSGPKKRFQEEGFDLDFTYVCPRLIAMAFPASGFEQLYRNPIEKVSKLIEQRHGNNYLIFNLSNRKYDTSKFQNKVLDYEWEDHHSPPMHTLFEICETMDHFLTDNNQNVVITHCLAGKGRTGTIICCYLMYSGRFQTPEEALTYYGRKRFKKDGLGVNQPCQVRYVYYFYEILKRRNIYPTLCYIKTISLIGRSTLTNFKPFFEIIQVKNQEKIFHSKVSTSDQPTFGDGNRFNYAMKLIIPLTGDILIRLRNNGAIKDDTLCRFSFNTAFINDITEEMEDEDSTPKDAQKSWKLVFNLSDLSPFGKKRDNNFTPDFKIEVQFSSFCLCSSLTPFKQKCQTCQIDMKTEQQGWERIYEILKKYKHPGLSGAVQRLFRDAINDDVNITMNWPQKKMMLQEGEEAKKDEDDDDYIIMKSEQRLQVPPMKPDDVRRKSDSHAISSIAQFGMSGSQHTSNIPLENVSLQQIQQSRAIQNLDDDDLVFPSQPVVRKTSSKEGGRGGGGGGGGGLGGDVRKRSNGQVNIHTEEFQVIQEEYIQNKKGGGSKKPRGRNQQQQQYKSPRDNGFYSDSSESLEESPSPLYHDPTDKIRYSSKSIDEYKSLTSKIKVNEKGLISLVSRSSSDSDLLKQKSYQLLQKSFEQLTNNEQVLDDQIRQKCHSMQQYTIKQGDRVKGDDRIVEELDDHSDQQEQQRSADDQQQQQKRVSILGSYVNVAGSNISYDEEHFYTSQRGGANHNHSSSNERIQQQNQSAYLQENSSAQINRSRQLTNISNVSNTSEFSHVQPLNNLYQHYQVGMGEHRNQLKHINQKPQSLTETIEQGQANFLDLQQQKSLQSFDVLNTSIDHITFPNKTAPLVIFHNHYKYFQQEVQELYEIPEQSKQLEI